MRFFCTWNTFILSFLLLVFTFSILASDSSTNQKKLPWPMVNPETVNIDAERLENALEYIRQNAGQDGIKQTIVLRNNKLIYAGSNISKTHNVYSVTKSFTSTALGLLIDEGKASLDTRICVINKQYCQQYPTVTLQHLASMTSGYNANGENRWGELSADWSKTPFDIDLPLFEPGTAYAYWDEAMIVFGDVLSQIAGESLYTYLDRKLMRPMAVNNWLWWHENKRPHGIDMNYGATGIELSAIDLAKYGVLMLNRGAWHNKGKSVQLIPEKWVVEATRNQIPLNIKVANTDRKNIDGVGYYGFNWWVNGLNRDGQRQMPFAPHDMFYARGFNNNMLFVIPSWNMVVVRMGLDDQKRIDKVAFYNEFFKLLNTAVLDNKPFNLKSISRHLGDPQGAFDTYFPDNSVAAEAVEFSPSGQFFASVSKSKHAKAALTLFSTENTKVVWQIPLDGETECLSFSANNEYIVTGGESADGSGVLQVFSVANKTQIFSAPSTTYPKSIEGLRFSPNYKMLATGDENGEVLIWNTQADNPIDWYLLQRLSVVNENKALADVNQLDWSTDSRFLFTAERDGDVHMYDVMEIIEGNNLNPVRKFKGFEGHTVKSVRVSNNNEYVAAGAGDQQGVRIWRIRDGRLVAHIASEITPESQNNKPLNAERIETIAFTNDSQYLLVGGTWPSWWFTANNRENKPVTVPISVFKINSSAQIPITKLGDYPAWRTEYIDIHPNNRLMVSGHDDGSVRLWEISLH